MNRAQLEHAIRAACQILGMPEIIIVGSQSILGTSADGALPFEAVSSMEVDVLPMVDDPDEIQRLGELVEGVAGELSPFEELHGFSIDGVDLDTCALADGWRTRLVKLQNANTAPPSGEPQFTGWCLDPEDACVAKLCAFRDKDLAFVSALLEAQLVDADTISDRLAKVPARFGNAADHATKWLTKGHGHNRLT